MSNEVLKDLKPYDVFHYFQEISKIPRGSGNEKGISDYLVSFAKKHNLEVIQDEALNIIIKKPGTNGYENSPAVIIQGHMDMVCEKNKDTEHDFEKDPLILKVDGDMLKACGTTLGADNGIAMAMAMALLSSKDIPHPPIEVLMTTDEETGMTGAAALRPSDLSGKTLINIDSEEEGKLLVSCSGGVRDNVIIPIKWDSISGDEYETYSLRIRGLKGGHSGMEINKGRGNSNKIMGRILMDLMNFIEYKLNSLNGGAKTNAIPREMDVVMLVNKKDINTLKSKVEEWNGILKNEFRTADPGAKLEVESLNIKIDKVFSEETQHKVINALCLILSGIQTMSMEMPGLVESSTNLGVVVTEDDKVVFSSAIRSSVRSLKESIFNHTKVVAELLGGEITSQADYPEWQYNPKSRIRDVFQKVYKDMYGRDPEIVAIHAGVECGLFKEKLGDLDMISFGPNMYDVHTPDEHLSISSVERSWDYLIEVLKQLK